MAKRLSLLGLLLILIAVPVFAQQQVQMVRVMGNYNNTDDEIVQLSGLKPGDEWNVATKEEVRKKLLQSGKFRRVEILERTRSTAPGSPIHIIINVEEKEELYSKLVYIPLVSYSEDYGWSYGAQVAVDDLFGFNEFITIPLQWGGQKKIAANLISTDVPGINKISASATWLKRKNPFFWNHRDTQISFSNAGQEDRLSNI